MKQSIVEVIAYLLEMTAGTFESTECSHDGDFIQEKLEDAGFSEDVVASTFDWLKELIEKKSWCLSEDKFKDSSCCRTFRVFSSEEKSRIGVDVRGFILSLEYVGILDMKMREVVISQLMQLNQGAVDLIDVKWVVLLVLMSDSNKNVKDMRSYLLASMTLED